VDNGEPVLGVKDQVTDQVVGQVMDQVTDQVVCYAWTLHICK